MIGGTSRAQMNRPCRLTEVFGIDPNDRRNRTLIDDIVLQMWANEWRDMSAMFIADNKSHPSRLTVGTAVTACAEGVND